MDFLIFQPSIFRGDGKSASGEGKLNFFQKNQHLQFQHFQVPSRKLT